MVIYPFMRRAAEKWFRGNPDRFPAVNRECITEYDVLFYIHIIGLDG